MKLSFVLLFFISLIIAIGAGWFFDQKESHSVENPLQIPDNIDYYMAEVKLTSFNEQGLPSYLLVSPYLEHFVREDISVITQPDIQYYAENADWSITAVEGRLQHKNEIFSLQQQVSIQQYRARDEILLTTEALIFDPENETANIPGALRLVSDTLDMDARSAVLDMKKERHIFEGVKATYDNSKKHESS